MRQFHVICKLNGKCKWNVIDYFVELGYDCSGECGLENIHHDFWFYEYNKKNVCVDQYIIENELRKRLNTMQVWVAEI